jgi:murein L,D-transpeptidase YcbB/YkuD
MKSAQYSTWIRSVALIVIAAATVSCKQKKHADGEVSHNWTPPKQEEYMGVRAADAQAAIKRRLAAAPPKPVSDDEWQHVQVLYANFGQSLLWLDDKGVHQPRVAALLSALANADSDAFRLDAFPLSDLSQSLSAVEHDKPTADQLANADVLLSTAFTTLGEQLLTGQEKPESLGQAWHINPLEERVDSALALTLREDDLAAGLVRMRPEDPGYDSLRIQLGVLRQALANGGWPTIKAGRTLGRGDEDSPRVSALRERLRAEGYLPDSAPQSGPYDRALAAAVSDFQTHHNLGATGTLNGATVEALNVPLTYRLAQIAANMERYRWMPRSLGTRYIMVNVPQFKLTAYDSGAKALEMKVIVGKDYEDKATPVFSDSMENVIFRPYWLVTPTIAAKEIFPRGPEFLAANDMEVYNDHGREAVRQRPGPRNALGYVKFMFPNDFNIYLHDTPNHELFKKDVRAFSHGCIRIEKPAELAQWALGWSPERVEAAMHGSDNHSVDLPTKIPVYIVYFTTFVDGGRIFYGGDLYDRDSRLVKKLADSAVPSPETIQAQAALREMTKSPAKN